MVFLKSIDKGKAIPGGQIVLNNNHCMFEPRVQGASVGQQLKIVSLDPILHNTHPQVAATGATLYNVALPFKGFSVVKPLPTSPELIQVKCDVHEWMRAWIHVFDHPYYASTDSAGHFTLTDVPPLTYRSECVAGCFVQRSPSPPYPASRSPPRIRAAFERIARRARGP